jgi:hypothetical protein
MRDIDANDDGLVLVDEAAARGVYELVVAAELEAELERCPILETPDMDSTSTACIRNLGIEVRTTDFLCDFPHPGASQKNYFREFLRKFCNLKTLGLITVPLPGDPDTVEFVEVVERDEDDGQHDEEHLGNIRLESLELPCWAGDLIRGEDGLRDWYCNALTGAIWDYVKESELAHLEEVLNWREKLVELGLSNPAKPQGEPSERRNCLVTDLDVRVLAHFREGVQPPEL